MSKFSRYVPGYFCLFIALGVILPASIHFWIPRLFVNDHSVLFVSGEDTHYEPSFHSASLHLSRGNAEISAYVWNEDELNHLFITPSNARNILLIDNKIVFDSATLAGEDISLPKGFSFVKLVVRDYHGGDTPPELLQSVDFVVPEPIEEHDCYIRTRPKQRILLERAARSAGFAARVNLLLIPLLILIRPATGFRTFFRVNLQQRSLIPIVVAVIAMFWLRLAGMGYQMQETIHPDESLYGNMIDQILTGKLAPSQFWYTTGYLFLTASTDRLLEWLYGGPLSTMVSQRAISALLSCLTCLLVYWSGKLLFSKRTGIVAAVLFGFSFLPIEIAHYGIVEPTVVFFFMLAFVFQIILLEHSQPLDFVKAGFLAGLSIAMKQSAVLIVIPFISVYALLIREGKIRKMGWREISGWISAACFAFSLFSPAVIFQISRFYRYQILQIRALQGETNTHLFLEGTRTLFGSLVLEIARMGFGYPLLAASAFGVIFLLKKRQTATWILIPVIFIYMMILFQVRILPEHYLLLLSPFIALSAAFALTAFSLQHRLVHRLLLPALVALLLLPSLYRAFTFQRILHNVDTRRQAEQWCYKNLPPGTNITHETFGPRFLIPVFGTRRMPLFRRPTWDQYVREAPNSYYVEDSITENIFLKASNAFPVEIQWQQGLRNDAQIVKEFHGEKFALLNPDIRIYRLRPSSPNKFSFSVHH